MPVPPPPTTPDRAVQRRLRKDEVYERLLAAILDGTLQPGERLRDTDLQSWLGVSRTPIRLAVDRLAEMRLVEVRANSSTRVSPARPDRIPQTIEAMCGLWALAAHRAIARLDAAGTAEGSSRLQRAAAACRETSRAPAEAVTEMREALYFFSVHADNELLRQMVFKVGADLRFQLSLPGAGVDFGEYAPVFDELASAVQEGDGALADRVFDRARTHPRGGGMTPVPAGTGILASGELLSETVRRRLLSELFAGSLKPGERLHDDQLTAWLGVSRTPLRTALEQLAEVGLVEMRANRYTRVASPTISSHRAALDVYGALHGAVARRAVPELTTRDVEILVAASDRAVSLVSRRPAGCWGLPTLEAMGAVTAFLSRRCANPVLLAAADEIDLRLAFSFLALEIPIDHAAVARCARAVVAASRRGDAEFFVAAMHDFLSSCEGGVVRAD